MELVTETDKAIEFVNGIVPQGLAEDAAKITQLRAVTEEPAKPEYEPPTVRTLTRAEIEALPQEELSKLGAQLASGEVKIAE